MQKRNGVRRTSIVDSFHEPALRTQVPINAIQLGLAPIVPGGFRLNLRTQGSYLDVPFLAGPRRFGPPAALSSPRPSEREDLPADTFATEERWLCFLKLNGCRKGGPVNANHRSRLFFQTPALSAHFW